MKRHLTTLFILAVAALASVAGESAADLLGRAAAKYQKAASITAAYTLKADGATSSGSITVAGNRFAISSRDMSVWFDGKTQWTLVPSAREVNVTEPTSDELQQVNPFAVINAFRANYNAAFADKGAGNVRVIKLTPKSKRADITSATVRLDASTLFPTEITLTDRSRRTVVIKVTSARAGAAVPASTFVYNSKSHPGVKVVDLR